MYMEKSKVAIIECTSYDENKVNDAIEKGINLIGGIESFVNKDEKILVKPNLLKAVHPEKAVTTNPKVFGAILKLLKENGYQNVVYGDSPGAGSSTKLTDAVKIVGFEEEANKYDVKLGNFFESITLDYKEGKAAKKFNVCKEVADADAIISICKMKTHALEKITGAIKNQYGCIYANAKALGHAKYPNSSSFSKMLVDLNNCLKPRLYIMDGIVAMEGNGPASGDTVNMNVILISSDPVAIDSVYASLVYVNSKYVPTCVYGEMYGLGNRDLNNIDIVTPIGNITIEEAINKYGKPDFNVNRKKTNLWPITSMFRFAKHKPIVDLDKCIGCGICQNACPVEGKAVHSGNGKKAVYNYRKCIRCYCCQEMCPAKAISRKD